MSYRKTVNIYDPDTTDAFQDAKDAAEEAVGEDLAEGEALRELAEAYRGNDALGAWRDE